MLVGCAGSRRRSYRRVEVGGDGSRGKSGGIKKDLKTVETEMLSLGDRTKVG